MPDAAPEVLTCEQWQGRARAHERTIDQWTAVHAARRSRGEKHPVEDFLFTYYPHRLAALRRWHPGWGVDLEPDPAVPFEVRGYVRVAGLIRVDPSELARRRDQLEQIVRLLEATSSRPAAFGCFGLHEWAMVYRQRGQDHRHPAPLRLGSEGTDAVVEGHRITCTHYDAFRFFTEPARPLNTLQPSLATRADNEQPGCLHAGMDTYKWAYKLHPIVGADLVAECFALARDIREVDMRASPYDLSALGYAPIRIETPEGKAGYVGLQRGFAERGAALRAAMIRLTRRALAA
ncbi:MAG: 3-methyladenine DNA glycosylase [Micropruina sp.]|nr:3-methyladenine DNA glycosylase [Micropruina sp.]